MPSLAAALLILLLLVLPSSASAQAGVSYQVPADNPFVGVPDAAPEVYSLGLRNPYRWSFDRQTGDVLIGDVGQSLREEIDWVSAAAARGANFGWACREGKLPGARAGDLEYPCPASGLLEPLFDYAHPPTSGAAVTGGFVVRDTTLVGLEGRYLYGDFFPGEIRSLAPDFSAPDDKPTGLALPLLVSFGEDASGRLYAVSLDGGVVRLVSGGSPGTLAAQPLAGPFASPIAIGTFPGDASRLFVAERAGAVRLVEGDAVRPTPFLDLGEFGVSTTGERGLASVVAAPDYAVSGHIYVFYTDLDNDTRIDEFTRSEDDPERADPMSRRNILTIERSERPWHHGGQMHFGSDGCLWIATGDAGGGGEGEDDELNNAQDPGTLLGKLLRIDPDPRGVGGPVCGAPVPAAAPPGQPVSPAPDGTAPSPSATARRRQRVLRLGGAVVRVRCDEACSVSAGGTLLVRGRKLLLRRAAATLAANERSRLLVRVRPRARRLLRTALRRGGHPRVVMRLRATDGAGNRSAAVRRGVRVRR